MAFFIPSSLQKRLLRYALSRLDFIETDDLDLDNLGITFGQRSVIELKDVGIQIKKLSSILQFPSTVNLTRARIRLLRLTIPADLYSSGIVVEIEGVDVKIRLHKDGINQEKDIAHISQSGPLNWDTEADRPRIVPLEVHDPGGSRSTRGHGISQRVTHAIPTSEDLAMSFLESELPSGKQELQDAISSQSQYLQESIVSEEGSLSTTGLGVQGGVSLPTFVANFFKGVGDRLSIKIQDVAMTIEMGSVGNENWSPFAIMLKIAHVHLEGIMEANTGTAAVQRVIKLQGFGIVLLADSEALSRTSTSSVQSSPRLSRSSQTSPRTALQPYSREESDQRISNGLANDAFAHSRIASGSGDSLHEFSSDRGPALASPTSSQYPAVVLSTHVDNRQHAELLAGKSILQSEFDPVIEDGGSFEDLAESKMFSHDEAESMYLSAVSSAKAETVKPMPGAWDLSESSAAAESTLPDQNSFRQSPSASESAPQSQLAAASKNVLGEFLRSPNPNEAFPESQPTARPELKTEGYDASRKYIAKHVLFVNFATISLPTEGHEDLLVPQASAHSAVENLLSERLRRTPIQQSTHTQVSSQLFGSQNFMRDSHQQVSSNQFYQNMPQINPSQVIRMEISKISVALDLPTIRAFLRATREISSILPQATDTGDAPKHVSQPKVTSVFVSVEKTNLDFCDFVPDSHQSIDELSQMDHDMTLCRDDERFMRLAISEVSYESVEDQGQTSQRLTVRKVVLGDGTDVILSFNDRASMRRSIAASGLARKHDVVVEMKANKNAKRIDIATKAVQFRLDLVKLDDFLSRSGGLSSLLELGNSIVSTNTVRAGSPTRRDTQTQPRSVRFQQSNQSSSTRASSTSPTKISVRIAGALLEMVGSVSTIQVKSSAVKYVYRDEILGMQIDFARIEGPIQPGVSTKSAINFDLGTIRFDYSNSPSEVDLDRLLSLLTPSNDRYDNDDDIMVDTLLRQRRKGGVLRLTINEINGSLEGIDCLTKLEKLIDELSKLSTVTKYLPEDDRPGLLTLGLVKKLEFSLLLDQQFGSIKLGADLLEGAHIGVPSLMAAQIASFELVRGADNLLFGEVIPSNSQQSAMNPPMLMCRFVADEMDPTIRLKLFNACIEYRVSTLVALIEMIERLNPGQGNEETVRQSPMSSPSSSGSGAKSIGTVKTKILLNVRDSALALNPDKIPARGLLLITDASFLWSSDPQKDRTMTVDLKKACVMIIDDTANIEKASENADRRVYFDEPDQVQRLAESGFVPVGYLSSASAVVTVLHGSETNGQSIDIELRNNLLILETCADSTQTLIQILNGLSPPPKISNVSKYRTEIVPIEDMLASFTGNAYFTQPGPQLGFLAESVAELEGHKESPEEVEDDETEYISGFFPDPSEEEEMAESFLEPEAENSITFPSTSAASAGIHESMMKESLDDRMTHSILEFRNEHFMRQSSVGGTAHRWNSAKGTYGLGSEKKLTQSPLKVRVRDVHVIWNLFDGYDWQSTRDTISQAVRNIEAKALSRRPQSSNRTSPRAEDDDESVIGDFLFNSIYIGIPANKDPRMLAGAINHDIDDLASETGSYATSTTTTASPLGRHSGPRIQQKKLKLNRSKQHKMTFELEGISADFLVFPSDSGEVESSLDVRVKNLDIFDHIPTSTWKKFATYMHDAGEREVDTNMIHLEVLNVKPVADLAASEMVLKVTILPLRLHVDQDALDFMTRFFDFKDDRASVSSAPSVPPFLQRVEVNPIKIKLDFKPKRVDYAGLRSGRTTEFMNFFILDRADMVLRRVILYGVSGFDRLGIMLNSIWMPDVKRNQLPGILAGLAPIRSLVDVGSGVKDLVVVPMREYKKDGRIVRSIQKGALAFAKTTTKELVALGAKLAIGTQTVLQDAERMLVAGDEHDATDGDDESKKQISLYADQPLGIVQGLRGAYASLEKDLLLARDAIVAVPGEFMASGSAAGAAKAVLRQSPTIILRPAIGASKAVGQTLLGAGNTLDRGNLRRMEEVGLAIQNIAIRAVKQIANIVVQKYKRH